MRRLTKLNWGTIYRFVALGILIHGFATEVTTETVTFAFIAMLLANQADIEDHIRRLNYKVYAGRDV